MLVQKIGTSVFTELNTSFCATIYLPDSSARCFGSIGGDIVPASRTKIAIVNVAMLSMTRHSSRCFHI